MSENSTIEWTDHTFNPWWGCAKVSPGCANCYAEAMARRFSADLWGVRKPRKTFGPAHWTQPIRWNQAARREGARARVFCASMADIFDLDGPTAERERLWTVIEQTPFLDWQILTKRPENILRMIPKRWEREPRPNIWFGATVETPEYLWRINELFRVPAAVRFLSIEPLVQRFDRLPLRGIHWVIVGGESGPKARPIQKSWILEIQDMCRNRGVAFFFKQWGGRRKKAAGRLLDGRTYDALPDRPASFAVGS